MTVALPPQLEEKGRNLACGRGRAETMACHLCGPEALPLRVSLMYFGGRGRDLKLLFVLLSFPRVWLAKGTSFKARDSFPESEVLAARVKPRRLAHRDSTATVAGPRGAAGLG